MAVVVVGLLLELREDALGAFVGPVGEHDDVLAVVRERLRLARLDDQRAVESALFLKPGVAVVPVGAGLSHAEPVDVGFAGRMP